MTEYYNLYMWSLDPDKLNNYTINIRERVKQKGVEVHNDNALEPAPPDEIRRVNMGDDPENNKYNWLKYVRPDREVKTYCHTMRLQGHAFLTGVLAEPPDDVNILVRSRLAGYVGGDNQPFSYDPEMDYYTEPNDE